MMMVVAAAALVDWIYVDCRAAVTIRDISSWFLGISKLREVRAVHSVL
jgi:hypothetical protein